MLGGGQPSTILTRRGQKVHRSLPTLALHAVFEIPNAFWPNSRQATSWESPHCCWSLITILILPRLYAKFDPGLSTERPSHAHRCHCPARSLRGVYEQPGGKLRHDPGPTPATARQRDYARYHEVLNRAVWSSRQAARILLVLLLQHLDGGDGPLIFGIDETLERRRGAKIRARAIYRDPVRSSRSQVVKASGLRWISLMWLGQVPWAGRHWALPVLTVLAPSTRYYQQQGRQHQKLTDWARQMVMQPRSW